MMQLILMQGGGKVPFLIKAITRSPFTHTAILYPDGKALHSSLNGVQMVNLGYLQSKYTHFVHYDCLFQEGEAAANYIWSAYGNMKYDNFSVVGLGIAILLRLKKNPLGRQDQFMCSEIPALWLNYVQSLNPALNIPEFDPEMVSPALLKEFCQQRTDLFKENTGAP